MKPRFLWLARAAGFVAFFLVTFVAFAAWTFPYERVRARIVGSFNAQQKPGSTQQELQIEELGGYFMTGVEAKGVKLLSASSEPGKPPVEIGIDEVRARLQLLPLLLLHKTVNFDADMLGGSIDGQVSEVGKDRTIDLEFDGIDIGQVGQVKQAIGLPLQGQLYGTIKLELPGGKASKGNGTIALELRELTLGDSKAKLKIPGMGGEGLTIQRLAVGTLIVEGEAKDGQLKLTKLSSNGPDLTIEGEGKVVLRELANESLVDVTLKLDVSEAYKKKSPANESLFMLLDMAPEGKAAKRPEGGYGIRLSGPLARLKPLPAGSVSMGSGGAGPKSKGATP